jgi:hypothetical protein
MPSKFPIRDIRIMCGSVLSLITLGPAPFISMEYRTVSRTIRKLVADCAWPLRNKNERHPLLNRRPSYHFSNSNINLSAAPSRPMRAIHRDREIRPDRVSDFWEALESGDIQMRGSSINMNWKRLLVSASMSLAIELLHYVVRPFLKSCLLSGDLPSLWCPAHGHTTVKSATTTRMKLNLIVALLCDAPLMKKLSSREL